MEPPPITEHSVLNENETKEEQTFIEIEIPFSLFQFLSSNECDVQNICRICLSTDNSVLYPLVPAQANSFLVDMFMSLVTVRPTPEDGLPSSICEQCQNLVVQYYDFKIKCQKSEYMLRSILNGEAVTKEDLLDPSSMAIKVDVKEEPDFVEDVEYLEELSDDAAESKLGLVQDTEKRKKRIVKRTEKGSLNNLLTEKKPFKKRTKSYTCIHCSKVFQKAYKLRIHLRSKHSKTGGKQLHPCGQCKEAFESEHDLGLHSVLHTKGPPWKCSQCQKQYHTKTTFRRHLQRHMQFKPHSCETCHKTFAELYALRRHERVHTGESIEKKYACHICDKRYTGGALLAAHLARHGGARPCECETCHKRFSSQRLLLSHMLVHTDKKPYACSYCDKRFRHESTRNTHHRTHTGEKPYVCSVCGKNFIQNSNLTLHMRSHTGERPYSCTMCERKFTSGSSLKSHQRIHTGERPYSCEVCGKRFARMNLRSHMSLHTGEKPFACSACPKKFTNASRLKEHVKIHTGEKPYECATCSSTFTTKSQLIKHLKTHDLKRKKITAVSELVILQDAAIKANVIYKNEGKVLTVNNDHENIDIKVVEEVPLKVTGELILQDDSDMKADLQNNYPISNNDICLNSVNSDNYSNDMNLVTVNEGVSISSSNLEGTTVKLYQVDQSLLQIHSSGGQVTISKITSKMTANF